MNFRIFIMKNSSLRIIQRKHFKELHLQLIPLNNETDETFCKRISDVLVENNANIVRATFFGSISEKENVIEKLKQSVSGINFPVTWIEGGNCTDSFINGVYIFAVSGIEVKPLSNKNQIVGSLIQLPYADYCYLGGLYSGKGLSPYEQTLAILQRANNILNQVNFKFENTVRTWFYLDDILEWYNDFNKARTLFFNQHDIFSKLVPASTGISGKNKEGSAVSMELNAIIPKSADFSINRIMSPLQCSAENYGSSFSRAIMFSDEEYSVMTISGTASINEKGESVFQNNIKKQIEKSFSVLMAIVDSRKFSTEDIIRAYAYCSDRKYYKDFIEFFNSKFTNSFACICAENKICRHDLLFEIEMDLIKKKV